MENVQLQAQNFSSQANAQIGVTKGLNAAKNGAQNKVATQVINAGIETVGDRLVKSCDKEAKLSPKLILTKEIAQEQLGEFLDVEVDADGTLTITANDKEFGWFDDAHSERSMGQIRSKLGLRKGVLKEHNPDIGDRYSKEIVRGWGSTPDDGILVSGASITIPASEVGKDPHFFQWLFGTFDDLKD